MSSLPFLAAIFCLLLQNSSTTFQFRKATGYRKNVDSNFIGPAKKYYSGTKPKIGSIPKPGAKYISSSQYMPQYVLMTQYIPTSGSIFANVPSVAAFTSTFLETVYSQDILHELFDLSQTSAKQYVDFISIYGENYLDSLCVEHAAELVEFAFRGVLPNFDVLTLPVVSRFYANCIANFLHADGFLCEENAEDIALAYAQSMADCAKVSMNSDPASKFQVLGDGFVNFLELIGMSRKEKVPFLAFFVGNEWFVAAANYKMC